MDLPNIPEIWARCKAYLDVLLREWGTVVIVLLVALSSFGIGRISAGEAAKPVVSVTQAPLEQEVRGMAIGGLVVASRNGSVYHFPWCSGADQIKPENRVWYATEEAAQKAGYSPSKSCKGLSE